MMGVKAIEPSTESSGPASAMAENSSSPKVSESARTRPRLLSYVGRWGRARRWLLPEAHSVVDLGCSFGYGTAAIRGHGSSQLWVAGVERDGGHMLAGSRLY